MLITVLNGIAYGSVMYLVAVGLVFMLGMRRIANFAHGSFYALGAYVSYTFASMGYYVAGVVAATLLLFLLGVLLDIVFFRRLQKFDPIVSILLTYALLLVMDHGITMIWGHREIIAPVPSWADGTVQVLGTPFPVYRLFVIVAGLVMASLLAVWLRSTDFGLVARGISSDMETLGMLGARTTLVSGLVAAIGAGLAGFAGALHAPLVVLTPGMGSSILITSFIIVVTGKISSIMGAFVVAMTLGQLVNFGIIYFPQAATLLPFVVMIMVLLVRQSNLLKGGS